jgi:hypothetical protein
MHCARPGPSERGQGCQHDGRFYKKQTNGTSLTTTSTFVPPSPEKAALDSGCTTCSNLIQSSTKCLKKTATSHGLRVGIPNGTVYASAFPTGKSCKRPTPHPSAFNTSSFTSAVLPCNAMVQPALKKSLISLANSATTAAIMSSSTGIMPASSRMASPP